MALQVPVARFGTTAAAARTLLLPPPAAFALGGVTMALSATGGPVTATLLLTASAAAFTLAEMLHATVSWELSVALARRHRPARLDSLWRCHRLDLPDQHRLIREPLARTPLSVPPVTVSEH
ncbi:hypothetical protein AB0I77_38100 [Streptomyces sp. NPDC050619]|uniref:hypothetical protein n=1 Tax=Streptomyces sp. NPDC050619 TaxID=3157214 RepID=UPI00342AE245